MSDIEHSTLVTDASRGDPGAIEALLARHMSMLLGYLRLHVDPLIRQHESCTDLAQSVCRDVLEDLATFEYRGEAAFRSWLCTKALAKLVNRKRDHLARKRDARRTEPLPSDGDVGLRAVYAKLFSPSEHAIAHETANRLEAAFDQLPEDYKRVITMSRVIGMSHGEIAAELHREEGAVRVLLHRALVRLGRLLHEGRTAEG